MSSKSVSIYDIATIAGVSTATVSNVLNGKGRYSERTKAAIKQIARDKGYVANFAAKSLRETHTRSIGLITPDVSNDFHSTTVLCVERLLHARGYTSYICNSSNDPEIESEYLRDLLHRRIDGVIFIGGSNPLPDDNLLSSIPAVSIDRELGPEAVAASVNNDVRQMFFDITSLLADKGCSSLAYLDVRGHSRAKAHSSRYKGYVDALKAKGIPLDRNLILAGSHEKKSNIEAEHLIDVLIDEDRHFDGIVAVGDRIALGAVNSLKKHGIAVGTDVMVMGADNSLYSRISSPSISTVDRDTTAMANVAVEALMSLLGGHEPASSEVVIPHRIIERQTTGAEPPLP